MFMHNRIGTDRARDFVYLRACDFI